MSFNIEVESGKTVKLPTAGKYCDRDILVTATGGGDGGYTEEDLQAKYDLGYEHGHTFGFDEGEQTEYDRFWDALQENGKDSIDYRYKFFYWPNESYDPKYPIRSTKTSMISVFGNARIENTIVDVDFSRTTNCSSAFSYCTLLRTIPKLIVSEKNTFSGTFQGCTALVNVTVEGNFGSPVDFQWSTNLSKASITSIINALSTTTSGLSVTFSEMAVNNAFTADEWAELAATKTNWTINLL